MKKGLILLVMSIIALCMFYTVKAEATNLHWDIVPNTAKYTIAGYNMYWGLVEGEYTGRRNVGNVNTVTDLKATCGLMGGQRYYFVVSAYTLEKEGLMSDSANYVAEAGYTPPPDTVIEIPEGIIPPKVIITIEVINHQI